jgi:prepilin-type N-terminal cleavage/methylation domain-containing protein
MKKINLKTRFKIFCPLGNAEGFTLIEALVSMVILSVGILGLAASVNSVSHFQQRSKDVTLATMYMANELENIKRFATNEPTGGNFGFGYLVDSVNGLVSPANGYAATSTTTRTANVVTPDGFTVQTVLTVFPGPPPAPPVEDFTVPNSITMVDAQVTTSWVDHRGNNNSVVAGTILHRRQFVQSN